MDNSRIIELKKRLARELQKEMSNNNTILSLSSEIAKYDKDNIRFSVDAGIINRLGKELVGRHETAVSELVKNTYDADATEVNLYFENALNKDGTLVVEDNGLGMTRDQLINGFMRLSSADKIHNPISPKYKRTRAGKKGIGRFATQRLGHKLTIITQTKESVNALKVVINWDRFESDKDLVLVTNNIVEIPKEKEEGTSLIIENLRDGWSDAMIKRVYRYTSDLLQPFPLSKKRKRETKTEDLGFNSAYYRRNGVEVTAVINEEEAFFNHALAEIEGFVEENGQGCWFLESQKLNFTKERFLIGANKDQNELKFKHIRGVHFKCYYFIYETSLLPSQMMTFIRSVANERGGIRLYRNGFRVLPYGEKNNDWIGLDETARRRVIISPIQNNSFFGFVEVSDSSSTMFDETSSREGVIENDAFHELTDFVLRSITSAVVKVAQLRGRKGTASQKDWKKKNSASQKVDEAIQELQKKISSSQSKDTDINESNSSVSKNSEVDNALRRLIEGRKEEAEEKKKLIDELNMLRILAGLGLVIGEFVHEIKNYFPGIHAETSFLKRALKDYKEGLKRIDNLEQNVNSLTTYSSYFDEAISRNVHRELTPIELRDVVYRFEDVIKYNLKRTNISFEKPVFEGFDLFTIPMHPSEWASILFNFYTNSKKAIRRAKVEGKVFIRCGREDGNVFLEFSDNGDGIAKEKEEEVFNAFYTTSSAAGQSDSEIDSLTGTGLGLKIVNDIIESYNGSVYVTTPHNSYSTTMRVEVPENLNE